MKTLIKILRSMFTSLLFIILTFAIIIQFVFTSLKVNSTNIPNSIDRQILLSSIIDEEIEDPKIKEIALNYVDDYIKYIFHKRSYPSLQTVDYKDISEENLPVAKTTITKLNENLNLEYETVVNLREANALLSNGATYLLINIGIFVIFIIVVIYKRSFKDGIRLSSIALVAASLISTLAEKILLAKLPSILNETTYIILKSMLTKPFLTGIGNLALTYISIGLLILLVLFLYDKFIKNRI